MRRILRCASALCWAMLFVVVGESPAKAEVFTVTGPQDFYFEFNEPTTIEFRTYAQDNGIDSMLWFYGAGDTLLVVNDDYYGLDSFLSYQAQPGITYRLRTGVCCGNPNAWYGNSYSVESNQALIVTPEPPASTTTTTTEETTTTVETTTTSSTTTVAPQSYEQGTAQEGETLTLTAPAGQIFTEVLFASYGTPTDYQLGNCHAPNSAALVAERFLGESTAQIGATNDIFGDPCGGTYKRLQVRLAYAEGTEATTTTTTEVATTTTEVPTTSTQAPETTQAPYYPPVAPPSPAQPEPEPELEPEPEPEPEPPAESESAPPAESEAETVTAPEASPTPEPDTGTEDATQPEPEDPTDSQPAPDQTDTDSEAETEEPEAEEPTTEEPKDEEPLAPETVEEALQEGITNLSPESLAQVLNPTALAELSEEQAGELIASLAEAELTEAQAEAVAEAMTEAPPEIKAKFESTINIFGGQFDSYVPLGSKVSVGERRTVVAASAAIAVAAAPPTTSSRRKVR